MKSFIWRFVSDESGEIDGLTVFSLTVGFAAAIWLLHGTVVALFFAVFGLLPVH